jgi:alkylmercury lyase-like protein
MAAEMRTPGEATRDQRMDLDLQVKLAIYRRFATTGHRPEAAQIAREVGADVPTVLGAFRRLRAERVLFLEPDDATIRMAPPFSGVPTQHVVEAGGVAYHANCAWDALGIPAALGRTATVRSRCEQSLEPLRLDVTDAGPGPSEWLFHCLVPAAQWWQDLVFT